MRTLTGFNCGLRILRYGEWRRGSGQGEIDVELGSKWKGRQVTIDASSRRESDREQQVPVEVSPWSSGVRATVTNLMANRKGGLDQSEDSQGMIVDVYSRSAALVNKEYLGIRGRCMRDKLAKPGRGSREIRFPGCKSWLFFFFSSSASVPNPRQTNHRHDD